MDKALLLELEREFLSKYPGGFENEDMKAIAKKHKLDKMEALVKDVFSKEKFLFPEQIVEDMIKVVSRASMVSVFEKPKFRDYVRSLTTEDKEVLSESLKALLYGNKEAGFTQMVTILDKGKLAKWSLMTIIPVYFNPIEEVFVKPTTTKNVIKYFGLEDIHYRPKPSYDFYVKYKGYIEEMKGIVNPLVAVNNPAFTGFLMMVTDIQN